MKLYLFDEKAYRKSYCAHWMAHDNTTNTLTVCFKNGHDDTAYQDSGVTRKTAENIALSGSPGATLHALVLKNKRDEYIKVSASATLALCV